MIPKRASRYSERIMRKQKNLDHDPMRLNWIVI